MFPRIPDEHIHGVIFRGDKPNASFGGGSNVRLSDEGEKTPDFAIYERPDISDAWAQYPTIAWEVGYSETAKNLAKMLLGWWQVLLVVYSL